MTLTWKRACMCSFDFCSDWEREREKGKKLCVVWAQWAVECLLQKFESQASCDEHIFSPLKQLNSSSSSNSHKCSVFSENPTRKTCLMKRKFMERKGDKKTANMLELTHTHTHIKHRILIHSLSLDIKISKQSEIPLIFLDVRLFFLHPLSIPIRCVSRMVLVLWCFALKCQIRFYLDVIWPYIVLLLLPLLLLLLYFLSSFCSARLFAGILI